MAICDLLVAYDDSEGAQSAARFGALMAAKYGAKLTGVYVYQPEQYGGSSLQRWIPQDVMGRMREAEEQAARDIETHFRDVLAAVGFAGETDFIILKGQPSVLVPRISRYFDLTLFGQFYTHDDVHAAALAPSTVLLRTGKPILVVPRGYQVRPLKETAMVSWDASRSAARALTDAMQILETKNRLDVVHLESDRSDWEPPSADHTIIDHLKRHGINAQLVSLPTSGGRGGMGATLLEYAVQQDPDVLVMGAYGRGKFGNVIFGSMTKHVLAHMSVPVLLSH